MTQTEVLKRAAAMLVDSYLTKISEYSIDDFTKRGVDPFRFGFNVAAHGLRRAVRNEIEHKMQMTLENLLGDFHEYYLGNSEHLPTHTRWEVVPEGEIPGVDIANRQEGWYLQVKSKHNSMNRDSSRALAEELRKLRESSEADTVGCGWVIAGPSKKCIGEKAIAEVATVLKGRDLYAFVTGAPDEMDGVVEDFLQEVKEALKDSNLDQLIEGVSERVVMALERAAKAEDTSPVSYLFRQSVK